MDTGRLRAYFLPMPITGFGISVSGVLAQSTRVAVSADNTVNVQSTGVPYDQAQFPPSDGSTAPAGTYQPRQTNQVSREGGGVDALTALVRPASYPLYFPDAPDANAEGIASRPNVDLGSEIVNQQDAARNLAANVRVLQAQDEQLKTLLDIKS
jgi:flagellar basal body rod protein FlgC